LIHWFRRLPAYALNGACVSIGVGLVQLIAGSVASKSFAQAASTGAVLASLPHLTARARTTLVRTLFGGLLATVAGLLVSASAARAWSAALAIGVISFVALLGMAWGTRAQPVVFSVIIGMVFSLARPSTPDLLPLTLATGGGVALYSLWACLCNRCLEPRYRKLAVFAALDGATALLRARAEVLSERHPGPGAEAEARFGQLREEVRLADALQKARDLVHPAARERGAALDVALLSRLTELRELLLTSRLDLELLGHDHAARFVRARLALGLRLLSARLAMLAQAERLGARRIRAERDAPERQPLPDLMEAATLVEPDDDRVRLLPTIANRLRYMEDEIEGMRALLFGDDARPSLLPDELTRFVADDDSFPVEVLVRNFSLDSPVLRHALRSSLAFVTVYSLAQALPWTTRPYWLLLSVAVVLRGTLDDTLTRRNPRVSGTALGCMLVTLLVPVLPDTGLKLVFVGAVGVSHAFVNVRYLLTAVSATVMALLQAHFAAPLASHLVFERLLDTVLGALLASLFSYVLPSWERRTLPAAIERALVERPVAADAATAARLPAMMARLIADVTTTPLAPGLTLAALDPSRRLTEWPFLFAAPALQLRALRDVLTRHGYPDVALEGGLLSGFVKGFIDMVVEHEGRFWIIDWKSNHLGSTPADYGALSLEAAMAHHAYHLQALLYTVALHRYLKARQPRYDYETHIAGYAYVFVRGVRPGWQHGEHAAGVHARRPDHALVVALDALMDGGAQ